MIYQGDSVLVLVDLGDGHEISVRLATNRAGRSIVPEIGKRISLGLHAEDTIIVSGTAS